MKPACSAPVVYGNIAVHQNHALAGFSVKLNQLPNLSIVFLFAVGWFVETAFIVSRNWFDQFHCLFSRIFIRFTCSDWLNILRRCLTVSAIGLAV